MLFLMPLCRLDRIVTVFIDGGGRHFTCYYVTWSMIDLASVKSLSTIWINYHSLPA
jgi:hypothetical protein